jgi:hypothetical protein
MAWESCSVLVISERWGLNHLADLDPAHSWVSVHAGVSKGLHPYSQKWVFIMDLRMLS